MPEEPEEGWVSKAEQVTDEEDSEEDGSDGSGGVSIEKLKDGVVKVLSAETPDKDVSDLPGPDWAGFLLRAGLGALAVGGVEKVAEKNTVAADMARAVAVKKGFVDPSSDENPQGSSGENGDDHA